MPSTKSASAQSSLARSTSTMRSKRPAKAPAWPRASSPDVEPRRQLVDQVQEIARAGHERVDVAAGRVVHVLPRLELDVFEVEFGDAGREGPGLVGKIAAQAPEGRRLRRRLGVLPSDPTDVLAGQGDDHVGLEVMRADLLAAVADGGDAHLGHGVTRSPAHGLALDDVGACGRHLEALGLGRQHGPGHDRPGRVPRAEEDDVGDLVHEPSLTQTCGMAPSVSRRTLLVAGVGLVIAACSKSKPPRGTAAGSPTTLPATPPCGGQPSVAQTEGPYFKPNSPEKSDLGADVSKGTRLVVSGTVMSTSCQPARRTLLDIWQADADGNYDNSGNRLRGHLFADDSGRYRFETVVPGLYPGRTRHIHVKVQAPDGPLLTTQLYFPGEPRNATDDIFDSQLLMKVNDAADGKTATFDFVVRS